MKWLKKKNRKIVEAKTKAANRIAFLIGRLKIRCAGYLDKKINPLPVAKKRLLLFVFCLLSASYCVLLLLSPFRTVQHTVAVKVEPIPFTQPPSAKQQPIETFIPAEQYKRIHAFKLYLDSLAKDSTNQKVYDSIIRTHPGIKDSLQKIEEYYQLQK